MVSASKFVSQGFFMLSVALLSIITATQAAPVLQSRQAALQALSVEQIQSFRPFTAYAGASYCQPESILQWACGENCEGANPNFQPIAAGGDGADVQFWYVGIDPDLQTIIVGHQGTDPTEIEAILTDVDFRLDELEPEFFPGLSNSAIRVHNGFAEAHAETAADVRAAVEQAMAQSGLNSITLVGHSLGGALTLLDAVSLPLFIPNASYRTIVYGMPRVGNAAFVQHVNANIDLTRINNQDDLVPILPGRFLGFRHAQGELNIQDDLNWLICPGNDNTDGRCTTGDVETLFHGSIRDHEGPYDGVTISSSRCT